MSTVAAGGKPAHSRFVPRERFDGATLMEISISSGRTHQIRVHAAHLGHPVAGDRKYGDREVNRRLRRAGLKRMFLHAWRLGLPELEAPLAAPLPEELETVLQSLREADAG